MRKLTSFRSFSLNSSQYDATDIFFSRPYTWSYTNDKYITLTKLYEKAARIQNTCAMVGVTKKEIKLWEEQDSGD